MDIYVETLGDSPNPSVAYRAHRLLRDAPEDADQRRRRRLVAGTPDVLRLLAPRGADGTIRYGGDSHVYRKFQGAHWTLAALAELGYPPGDPGLGPLVDQVHDWLTSTRHLSPPSTVVVDGQPDRVRRCASQEGLALWYLHELGLLDDRVIVLVERLVDCQWPDGGWNCDARPSARTSSVQETLWPLRGLARCAGAAPQARASVDRAAEFLLSRRLLWRRGDGTPIRPRQGRDPMRIQWPVRWYDVLSALVGLTEIGRLGDPRCADALEVLAAKRLAAGGFPVEERTARTSRTVVSGGTFADWGPGGRTRPNPYVSIDAAWVLGRASRPAGTPPHGTVGP